MVDAVEQVRQRLVKASTALRNSGVPHAVVGGNAVAAWVATVDATAVRNTQDVDILIKRSDLPAARVALEHAGFVYRRVSGVDLFLDGPSATPHQAVHIVFADEMVRVNEPAANPGVQESTDLGAFRVINLDALVRIKLTAYRDKDRTHLRDLIGVGLIDAAWLPLLTPPLAERLKSLLDTPDG
jgi:hypothetical protein